MQRVFASSITCMGPRELHYPCSGGNRLRARLFRDVHARSPSYERPVFRDHLLDESGSGSLFSGRAQEPFSPTRARSLHPSEAVVTFGAPSSRDAYGLLFRSRDLTKLVIERHLFGCPGERFSRPCPLGQVTRSFEDSRDDPLSVHIRALSRRSFFTSSRSVSETGMLALSPAVAPYMITFR